MSDELPIDFVIDFETEGFPPDGVILDMAIVPFKMDIENPPTVEELRESAFYRKFDKKAQTDRIIDESVTKWWEKQSLEAQLIFAPDDYDVLLEDGIVDGLVFIEEVGVKFWDSHLWAVGQDFDPPLLQDVIRSMSGSRDTFHTFPVRFYGQRDARTAIERSMGIRDMTKAPIRKELFPDFVAHKSVDDCIMTVLQLIYSERYAYGLEPVPTGDDVHPDTVIRKR